MIEAVLFDIDGTLLVTGGAGAVAWQRAFRELHGVDANIGEHTEAGMTDPEIAEIVFREVIGREGTAAERAQAIAGYLGHLADAVNESSGYRVMPGIEALLPKLAERGVLLGLVTGNIESAAHIKLARAGLNRFFGFGGYGPAGRWNGAARSPAASSRPATRFRSATPRAMSAPVTESASRSSGSPLAATRSSSSRTPAPTGRWQPSRRASRHRSPGVSLAPTLDETVAGRRPPCLASGPGHPAMSPGSQARRHPRGGGSPPRTRSGRGGRARPRRDSPIPPRRARSAPGRWR